MIKRKKNSGHVRHIGGKAPSQRQLRVGELIRHALSDILARGDSRDPVLASTIVTISEVRMTPDLRRAMIFVAPLSIGTATLAPKNRGPRKGAPAPDTATALIEALTRAKAFLRGELARKIELRHMPDLSFVQDTSFDYADSVDRMLRSRTVSRDLGAPAAAPVVASGTSETQE